MEETRTMKKLLLAILLLVVSTTMVLAQPVSLNGMAVGGTPVTEEMTLALNRGADIPVSFILTAADEARLGGASVDNVEVLAYLSGYRFNNRHNELISTVLGPYTMDAGTTRAISGTLHFPLDLELNDHFLYVVLSVRGDKDATITKQIPLDVSAALQQASIEGVHFTPGTSFRAGQGAIMNVRLANRGEQELNNVRGTLTVEGLGEQVFYQDTLAAGAQATSQDVLVHFPVCTAAGTYDYTVTLAYNTGRDSITETGTLSITESEFCKTNAPTTKIMLASDNQNIKQGATATYTVALTNDGDHSASYIITINTPTGISYSISPAAAVIVQAGQTRTLNIAVSAAEDAALGPQSMTATIMSSGELVQEVDLIATVTEQPGSTIAQTILLVVIILAIIAVVVILVISLVKRSNDGKEQATTYY